MISVAAAKSIITQHTAPLGTVRLPLQLSLGLVLAADVFAGIDIPAFPQSSVDGYAFSFLSWQQTAPLKLAGEMQAGSGELMTCMPGQAIRIFTGAAVPPGADTVVMQEKTAVAEDFLHITDEQLAAGSNVRPQGSEIRAGALALEKGKVISPAGIGFLAGIGVTHVEVYTKPAIAIIVTGKELQLPGKPLEYGQVYESNSAAIVAALEQLNIKGAKLFWSDDDPGLLTELLHTALQQADVVLLTGGVSVGEYDFVLEAAANCGVDTLFHKIKQKPGKPLFAGKKDSQLVFGLPGNPSSVLTCFYEYVLPALQNLSNQTTGLKVLKVPLQKATTKNAGLTHFLKGYFDGEKVSLLDAQESYRLSSFARANCLVQLDEATTGVSAGELVEIHLLPG